MIHSSPTEGPVEDASSHTVHLVSDHVTYEILEAGLTTIDDGLCWEDMPHVQDDSSDQEDVLPIQDDEVNIRVDDNGFLVKIFSYVMDYVHWGPQLESLSLWNFAAQVDKVWTRNCCPSKKNPIRDNSEESSDESSVIDLETIEQLLTMKNRL